MKRTKYEDDEVARSEADLARLMKRQLERNHLYCFKQRMRWKASKAFKDRQVERQKRFIEKIEKKRKGEHEK